MSGTSVEDDVLALLVTPQARSDCIALPSQQHLIGETLAALLELIDVASALIFAPRAQRVFGDLEQIRLGTPREQKPCHVELPCGDTKTRTHPGEGAILREVAGITLVDRGA